ncbi:hypothetical protein V1517DRAFT_311184 [Lipomyces orientalis]|uniref:Uncharacterized protein n=1 Tax=Lipomyces orientalis TaxID=1233043 RepID=A0ACC3TD46_9ASCO
MDPMHSPQQGDPVLAKDLALPEHIEQLPDGMLWTDVPDTPKYLSSVGTGEIENLRFSPRSSWFERIPNAVWVQNMHTDEISVVVSQYGPNRQISGAGVTASATGGGLSYNTTSFTGPATTKTLGPCTDTSRCWSKFPLWTRRNGFGVITIFKGSNKKLYIENDKVMAGFTAYFDDTPNLKMVNYKGEVITQNPQGIEPKY